LERRNGWTLAEQAGDGSPDGVQALLCSPCWDRDAVRDEARDYLVERIGNPAGVLIADETGFAKKGRASAGCSGSIAARWAAPTTARSGCSWPTPRRTVGR